MSCRYRNVQTSNERLWKKIGEIPPPLTPYRYPLFLCKCSLYSCSLIGYLSPGDEIVGALKIASPASALVATATAPIMMLITTTDSTTIV